MTKLYVLKSDADAYGLAYQLAAKKYNTPASALKIAKNDHGKPYFENLPDFHFNVSHSGDLKVLVVSRKNIGVDVEKLREVSLSVAKRFCDQERNYVNQTDSLNRFFEVWTKKEAYLKYLGTGISGGLDSLNVLASDIPIKTIPFGEYLISVCGDDNIELIDIR